jgi:aspartate/methionine/tyrosine aminotransferase
MDAIEPFHVMEVQRRAFELEAQGRRVIHMEIGQPDFSAPAPVIDAAIEALRREPMGYTATLGIPSLRAAIARYYADRYGLDIGPEQIIVTAGASGAFLIAIGALVDPGDEVLMPDPCYPCNRHFVRMFEGVPRSIPVDEHTQYQLTQDHVAQNWGPRTRGVIIASPSNPTGTLIPPATLEAIISEVAQRDGFVILDEIYQGLVYDGSRRSTGLSLGAHIFGVNSFSKYFSMTGWRLGWLVAPAHYVREMERLAQNAFISVSAPAQYAALAAFGTETMAILEARRTEFQRRRDFLVPALRDLGFSVPIAPDGAFYVYAGCERFTDDSEAFAVGILEEAGVAITPGCDFGVHRARSYVRFAYTRSLSDIEEGVARLTRSLPAISGPMREG